MNEKFRKRDGFKMSKFSLPLSSLRREIRRDFLFFYHSSRKLSKTLVKSYDIPTVDCMHRNFVGTAIQTAFM